MRNRLLPITLLAACACTIPAIMLASVDENRPPTNAMGGGVRLAWALPMIPVLGWCIFRSYRAYRRKERFDTIALPCATVYVIAFSFYSAMAFLNKHLDGDGLAMDMIVTDVFILNRTNHHDERLVVVSLPPQAGGTAIWQVVHPKTALSLFSIGSRARIIWHEGYFGAPWCEYIDQRFPLYHWRLMECYKIWRAKSAIGQFSPGSPHKRELLSWGIPVVEVGDLHELSSSDRR
jgi:hypothetical protein